MNLLLGSLTIGLILGVRGARGLHLVPHLHFADITVDGSITLGAAVAAVLLLRGWPPVLATLAAALAGGVAGAVTGILHAKFRIHGLLSGILVMTALYSVNLRIMGRSNVPLLSVTTLAERAESLGLACSGGRAAVWVWGWEVPVRDLMFLAFSMAGVALIAGCSTCFSIPAWAPPCAPPAIGVRMALGAGRRDVARLVFRQGFGWVLIGVTLGIGGALAVAKALRTLVYDINPPNPLALAAATGAVVLAAALACWLPARRAAQVEPSEALRSE